MAVDVVVRPSGRCITIVGDLGMRVPDRVVISGAELEGLDAGSAFHIGVLTSDMSEAAALCTIAVVVVMEGPYVHSSREVRLEHRTPS